MFNNEMLTHCDSMYNYVEVLALKSVSEIQIPVCNSLAVLTSTDCLKLIKYELDKQSNTEEPSMERILIFYLVTDYISCGLSSPGFHTIFHKYLNSETTKIKLVKDIITIWDNLFKNYKMTNVDFIKNLMVSLERIFIRMSILLPDDHIKVKCNKLMEKLKYYISIIAYEKNHLDNHTLNNSSMQLHNLNKNRVTGIENIVPKTSIKSELNQSIQSLVQKNQQKREDLEKSVKCMTLNNVDQKRKMDETLIDHHFTKKSKLMSSDVLNRNTTSDPDSAAVVAHEQKKLNVFQIMMLNAKKQKPKLKLK